MTVLFGDRYVCKTHPRIVFRGAIDSFIAELMLVIADAYRTDLQHSLYYHHLIEINNYVKRIQTAEATQQPMIDMALFGLSAEEIREHSQHPRQYYGINHLFQLEPDMDARTFRLNYLRTKAREMEIKGIAACQQNDTPDTNSLLTALNRLSSALYVMELRIIAGQYN